MGEEFALLNGLAAEWARGVFEEIWDLIFCRLSAPTAHRSHEQYFQRTEKKKNLVLFNHQEAKWSTSVKRKKSQSSQLIYMKK